MSSSPLDPTKIPEALDPLGAYQKSILVVDDLIEQGNSLSGHERNVCFLNLAQGTTRFATASAVTGIDYDDDARAVAPVDWDGDGDLDLWFANRTAPMLRFLKNTHAENRGSKTPADWLQVSLQASKGARDAIGARVTVERDDGTRLDRVLKAGEGFLTQNSKWLHFGLGDAKPSSKNGGIQRVRVRWPGRAEESFAGLTRGGRFLLVEGAGTARQLPARTPTPELRPVPVTLPNTTSWRALAGSRFPMPVLPWETFDGQKHHTGGKSTSFTLVNLWATWCAPCLKELSDFAQHQPSLSNAKVSVLALSVDGLSGDPAAGDPAGFARSRKLPFPAGRATPSTLRRIERARQFGWGFQTPLPVPSSLLIDPSGRLVAAYLGPVSPLQVAADAQLAASVTDEAWQDASVPFPGPWIERPGRPLALPLGLDLMAEDAVEDAREFTARTQASLSHLKEFATLLGWIGDSLQAKGDTASSLQSYISALASDPDNIAVLNNLAWIHATHPNPKIRNGTEAVRFGEKAATLTNHQDTSVLDTLAAAYAEAGEFPKAIATTEKALALAKKTQQAALITSLTQALKSYRQNQPRRQ